MGITELGPLLGMLCVIYTSVEMARLATRARPSAKTEFAALDLDSGRAIDVTIDRRTGRARSGPAGRRSARSSVGPHSKRGLAGNPRVESFA